MKRFAIILPAVFLLLCSCEQKNIFYSVDCVVTLDEENTYLAGDEVKFNFENAADNIVFYSGEDGHQYQYKDRYVVDEEDVNSMILTLMIQHRWGNAIEALEIYYTNDFEGLDGSDGQADRDLIAQMYANGMEGWTKFPYVDSGPAQDVYYTFEEDVSNCISNLCIAFHWNPTNEERIDTYWVNGTLDVEVEGAETVSYDLSSLLGTVVMMNEINGTYYYFNQGNGSIRLNATQDIVFAGGYATNFDHDCEGWLFSYPRAFNTIDADTGEVVKNLQNYATDYSYTYEEPGTYTATFVSTNTNYIDSDRKVQELTVTIVDNLTDYMQK